MTDNSEKPIISSKDLSPEELVKYLDHLARCHRGVLRTVSNDPQRFALVTAADERAIQQAANMLRGSHETGGRQSERYRVALQKIIDDGDYTAPEGTKLVACEALADNGTCESRATLDVLAERRRQVTVEGWTPEYDDQHNDSELAEAAVAYASHAASRGWSFADSPDEYHNDRPFPPEKEVFGYGDVTWPKHWSWDWWKPKDPRRDLVRAAALLIAEIERLDRCSQKASERREYHANGTYWSGVPTVDMPCDFCTLGITEHDPRTHACPPKVSS